MLILVILAGAAIGIVLGLFGIIGTFAGAKVGVMTPVVVQLVLFALVMYAAAAALTTAWSGLAQR